MELYDLVKSVLPSTYPVAQLAFFETEEHMLKHSDGITPEEDENVYAVVDPETLTINLPLKMEIKYKKEDDDEIYTKTVSINKFSDEQIIETLLHECGHLYYGSRYGWGSKQYSDEKLQDAFAKKWLKKMKKAKLI
jgi:hypothetical protein